MANAFLYTPVQEAVFQTFVDTDACGGAQRFQCVEMAVWVSVCVCMCLKGRVQDWERERAGACVAQCVKVWEKWKETAGVRRGGCRTADKGAYEATPHDTLTHMHTTQRDVTLITAEIDLTLLKTVCGGEVEKKEWDVGRGEAQERGS